MNPLRGDPTGQSVMRASLRKKKKNHFVRFHLMLVLGLSQVLVTGFLSLCLWCCKKKIEQLHSFILLTLQKLNLHVQWLFKKKKEEKKKSGRFYFWKPEWRNVISCWWTCATSFSDFIDWWVLRSREDPVNCGGVSSVTCRDLKNSLLEQRQQQQTNVAAFISVINRVVCLLLFFFNLCVKLNWFCVQMALFPPVHLFNPVFMYGFRKTAHWNCTLYSYFV